MICLICRLIPSNPGDPGEAHRDPRLVAAGALDIVEQHFEHEPWLHGTHRSEPLRGVAPDPPIQLDQLGVGVAGIGLADGDEMLVTAVAAPDAEGVVGIIG